MAKRFDEICTTPHVKRAAEVAITGGYTIWFIGPHESAAREMAEMVVNYGDDPREANEHFFGTGSWGIETSPCLCGYYGDPQVECVCSAEQVNQWRLGEWPTVMPAMTIYVPRPEPKEVVRFLKTGRSGEKHEQIEARIRRALEQDEPESVEEMAWVLLEQFVKVKHVSPEQARDSLAVARTVARLGGADAVKSAHMAEALQYRVDKYI